MANQSLQGIGIEETLDYFDLADSLIQAIKKSKEGNSKIKIPQDLIHFFEVPGKLFAAITGSEQIKEELRDLDSDEADIIEQRIAVYGPAYAKLVRHLMLAAMEVWNIVDEKKENSL